MGGLQLVRIKTDIYVKMSNIKNKHGEVQSLLTKIIVCITTDIITHTESNSSTKSRLNDAHALQCDKLQLHLQQ